MYHIWFENEIRKVLFTVATEEEYERYGFDTAKWMKTSNGYFVLRPVYMGDMIAALGYNSWDVLPQDTFNAYYNKHGKRPEAIFVYDRNKVTRWNWETLDFDGPIRPIGQNGDPVSTDRLIAGLGGWFADQILTGADGVEEWDYEELVLNRNR